MVTVFMKMVCHKTIIANAYFLLVHRSIMANAVIADRPRTKVDAGMLDNSNFTTIQFRPFIQILLIATSVILFYAIIAPLPGLLGPTMNASATNRVVLGDNDANIET